TGINFEEDILKSINVNETETMETDELVLATGQSAVDVYEMIQKIDCKLEQKNFSMGFRVEHSQEKIDEAQYGDKELAGKLGVAEYKLSYRAKNGRGIYTFCMCPGGEVITASSKEGHLVVNGMSLSSRASGIANSGILVDVRKEDYDKGDVLDGIRFRELYEKKAFEMSRGHKVVSTNWRDFRENRNNRLRVCLPDFVVETVLEGFPVFGRKIKGFVAENIVFKGVETRSSSPVRILRDEALESSVKGVYPGGEGAGYAGGITSAAVDGIRIAEVIAGKYV
ncbi:MAG: NAD(P)/FAD-dependent oxidoreductase, partial [Anaerovoracaceae bacterium]